MRISLCILLLVAAACWSACHAELDSLCPAPTERAERPWGWRRTVQGWEKSEEWWKGANAAAPSLAARIHPGFWAVFQLEASLGALVLFSRPSKNVR